MTIQIERLHDSHMPGWNDLVNRSSAASFFHLSQWPKVLTHCFPYRCRSLVALDGTNKVAGILPLMAMNSPLTGKALISLPMGIGAGPLAETEAAAEALVRQAIEMAQASRVKYLELRNVSHEQLPSNENGQWIQSDGFAIFEEPLADSAEAALMTIPRKQRAEVRRGMEADLVAEVDNDLDAFYPLHCRTVRNHGTPPMPRRYFNSLLETFGNDVEVLTVRKRGEPVCGVLTFYHREVVYPFYAGANNAARKTGGFAFMYHALMAQAISRGAKRFNFGRSFRDSGAYDFKVNFGFAPKSIPYQFFVRSRSDMPALRPDNPKLRPLLSVWRKLPLPLTIAVGSRVAWMAP